ncbi:MAG: hypothetical protein HXY40_06705 [Chloroflexi bacterium]|nr:hypothetical protein [Chloroflexota bacterium]
MTLQNLDAGTILLIVVGCGLLCVVGIGLLFSMQILASVVGMFSGVVQVISTLIQGGPLAWCGCILLFVICIAVVIVGIWFASILATCGTPDAVNFCRFFG